MTRLSVNINKIATLRNARGGNIPNVTHAGVRCEAFGAQGITVHPRPDGRHITYKDVHELKSACTTEFNIEGYPNREFIDLVLDVRPGQVTLVPDPPEVLTSNAGWDAIEHKEFLIRVVAEFKENGIRTSLFMETDEDQIKAAAETGTDRIELYTESYAKEYPINKENAVEPFARCGALAVKLGMGLNAGHDLDLDNLAWFTQNLPGLQEVSIGHALISDSLYLGLENTVQLYLREIENGVKNR